VGILVKLLLDLFLMSQIKAQPVEADPGKSVVAMPGA